MFTASRPLRVQAPAQAPFINYLVCLAVTRGVREVLHRAMPQVGGGEGCGPGHAQRTAENGSEHAVACVPARASARGGKGPWGRGVHGRAWGGG